MGLTLRRSPAFSGEPLPEPEEVFLSWLLAQPARCDLAAAADAEIERLRGYAGSHDGPRRLAALFCDFRASLDNGGARRMH